MSLRVFGIKEEASYGNLASGVTVPDFHHRVSENGGFALNDEADTDNGGSRTIQDVMPGFCKPTGSVTGRCDLKRLGHYLKAFFGNYEFVAGNSGSMNKHIFYGNDVSELPSFHGWVTYDQFEKEIKGLLLEGLKLECSDSAMNQTLDWIYQNEESNLIDESDYAVRNVEGAVSIMPYNIGLEINNTSMVGVIFNNFSLEGKNNLNQDDTLGFGSRFPQIKAIAQGREINISLQSVLNSNSNLLGLIRGGEYGQTSATSPTSCKIFKVPLKVTIATCDNAAIKCEMYFPQSTLKVEYSSSGAESIKPTFKLLALGTGNLNVFEEFEDDNPLVDDDDNPINTDCYIVLQNDMGEIKPNHA